MDSLGLGHLLLQLRCPPASALAPYVPSTFYKATRDIFPYMVFLCSRTLTGSLLPRAANPNRLKKINWGLEIDTASGLASFPLAQTSHLLAYKSEHQVESVRPFLTTLFKITALLQPFPHLCPASQLCVLYPPLITQPHTFNLIIYCLSFLLEYKLHVARDFTLFIFFPAVTTAPRAVSGTV